MSAQSWAERVGVIGAGAMGMGVVRSLRRHGVDVVVRDIRIEAEREASALGAQLARSPAELARNCCIAIVLVVDEPQVEAVLFGESGAAHAFAHDSIVVLSSTLAPDYVVALEPRLARHGVTLVDAPVSGGPRKAHDGSMTMMVGGPEIALARCAPLFAFIAGNVFRTGIVGTGAKCKIANNLLAAANLAAAAEAFALASEAGVDPAMFVELVRASSGASWIFDDRIPRVLAQDYAPRAATRVLAKDVGIAVDYAAKLQVDVPLARAARAVFAAAIADGYGEEDDASIIKAALHRTGTASKP
ncbi:MAG TPA: NAD(P)-dependent oxidoreductase [Casimicrobiaceae bacterium]|nr:NAD(P)-dependent oxidoreductase [Casimicrobiaceae bacterium]